jgi:RNA polymerase sigma-70 factor (ECF subfamily)
LKIPGEQSGVTDVGPGERVFEQLLAAAAGGDERAFTTLWRWLHPSLVRYLRGPARWDAEDLASEVWLLITRGLAGFTGDEAAFRAWAFTIARHRVVDAARRRSRRPEATAALGDEVGPSASDTATEATAATELDAALEHLRSLPPSQAEVIALRVIGGLSIAETAAVVGKSEGAVRVLAHRGLHQLRERLSAEAPEAEKYPASG